MGDETSRMTIHDLRIDQAELRGEVGVLRQAIARAIDRINQRDEERRASRRFTLTTVIAAGSLVLTAIGLIGGLLLATV